MVLYVSLHPLYLLKYLQTHVHLYLSNLFPLGSGGESYFKVKPFTYAINPNLCCFIQGFIQSVPSLSWSTLTSSLRTISLDEVNSAIIKNRHSHHTLAHMCACMHTDFLWTFLLLAASLHHLRNFSEEHFPLIASDLPTWSLPTPRLSSGFTSLVHSDGFSRILTTCLPNSLSIASCCAGLYFDFCLC